MAGTTAEAVSFRFGRFELQPGERRLLNGGTPLHLRPHAFDVLVALVERAGQLVTKDELLQRVWGQVVVEENTLQAHISALRKVLGSGVIATVAGRGYRFAISVQRGEPAREPFPANNLPHPLTSFVGRQTSLAELGHLLGHHRLITITGAGGCGKSRLAIELARQQGHRFRDGAWLVELAPLDDSALVPQTLATVLGISEKPGTALFDSIREHLAPRTVLLVLDNAEHLLDACAQLADGLLRRCEKLSVLITSREHLGVAGELAYRVPSLSLPDPQQEVTLETIAASEAARLFIDRARLQQPQFDVTPGNAAVLAAVCRRLDGIALALELAAPRVRSMSMQELSQRLDDRFGMLQQGARVALPRHRTLRSLIDWSYDLLDARERVLLQRVSVFAGGWTLAAAEQVCSGDDLPADAVLDRLTSLVDKNMVQADTREGETRYGLLETVRQYAGDHLRESGLEASIQDRLLNYVAALTSAMELQSRTTDQLAAIRCLEAEIDNVRAALSRALMPGGDVAAGLRTAIAACWFFETRGRASEGASWLSSLLAAAPTDLDKAERATALRWVGTFAFRQGDYAAAAAHREQGLALWKELGNQDNVSLALAGLGMIALARGDHDAARGFFTDGLAIARTCGNERRVHNLLIQLAHTAGERGDFATAHAHLEESLPIAQRLGSLQMNESLYHLGMVSYYQGDYPAARVCLQESLVMRRERQTVPTIAASLMGLALVAHEENDNAVARDYLREALTLLRRVGDPRALALFLEAFAPVACALAGPAPAAELWGGLERLRERVDAPMAPVDHERYARQLATARAALKDDDAFQRAWQVGRTMSFDALMQFASDLLSAGSRSDRAS